MHRRTSESSGSPFTRPTLSLSFSLSLSHRHVGGSMTGDQPGAHRDTILLRSYHRLIVPPGCRGLDILTASLGATYCALPPACPPPPPPLLHPPSRFHHPFHPPPRRLTLAVVTARCTRADAREFGRRAVDARRRRAHRCGLRRFPVILIDHSGRPPRLKLASITLSADG